jgi:hypothetical protein
MIKDAIIRNLLVYISFSLLLKRWKVKKPSAFALVFRPSNNIIESPGANAGGIGPWRVR